jgi:hypothetical protein
MTRNNEIKFWTFMGLLAIAAAACHAAARQSSNATTSKSATSSTALAPAKMARIGTVDDRYQSFNVEMLEVTGGKFWKPYGPELDAILRHPQSAAAQPSAQSGGDTPAGMDPRLYQYRPPIDLTNARLRKLAAALGAY